MASNSFDLDSANSHLSVKEFNCSFIYIAIDCFNRSIDLKLTNFN